MNFYRYAATAALLVLLAGCVTETSTPNKAETKAKQLQAQVDLGLGYLRNGEYARAKENLMNALELDPHSAVAHNTLALVFQVEQEYGAAEEHFKTAIKSDPSFTRARNNYGAYLYERGRYKEAIEQLKIASEDRFYVGRAAVFENLGVSYARVGNAKLAEQSFERATALNPEQTRALIELAQIRFDEKRFVESRELYRRYSRVASHSPQSLSLCIGLSNVFGNSDEKASCALALKNIFPTSPQYQKYQASEESQEK